MQLHVQVMNAKPYVQVDDKMHSPFLCASCVCVRFFFHSLLCYIRCTSRSSLFFLMFYFIAFVPFAQLHLAHVTRNCVRDYGNLLFVRCEFFFFILRSFIVSVLFCTMELNSYDAKALTKCSFDFVPFVGMVHAYTYTASSSLS